MTGVSSFAVNPNETTSPLYTEPYWGGYHGEMPSVKVYQVYATSPGES